MAAAPPGRVKFAILFLCLIGALAGYGAWELFLRPRYNFPRREADYYINDPLLGHRHRPYARREFEFPEHPRGRVTMRTNNLGMRMDRDVRTAKPAGTKRILVVGDSHFDGVVYNDESFAFVLEQLLNPNARSGRIEVLNASTGYYGPDQYLECLDAYRGLDVDHWMVGFYSGNDFLDAARSLESKRSGSPSRPWGYRSRLRRAEKRHAGAVAQLLNHAYYFKTFPEMRNGVLDLVEADFLEMYRRTRQDRTSLSLILIPTKWDVEPAMLGTGFAEAAAELGLDDQDLRVIPEMRLELHRRLTGAGISCWDPTEEMKQRKPPFFWEQDFHLDVRGHRLLAELQSCRILRQLTE